MNPPWSTGDPAHRRNLQVHVLSVLYTGLLFRSSRRARTRPPRSEGWNDPGRVIHGRDGRVGARTAVLMATQNASPAERAKGLGAQLRADRLPGRGTYAKIASGPPPSASRRASSVWWRPRPEGRPARRVAWVAIPFQHLGRPEGLSTRPGWATVTWPPPMSPGQLSMLCYIRAAMSAAGG